MRRICAIVVAAAALAAPASSAAQAPTRYSLAGGCYALSGVSGAEHVRMQATALARYLLYQPTRTFLPARALGSGPPAGAPSPAVDWRVDGAGGRAFTLTPVSGGHALTGV